MDKATLEKMRRNYAMSALSEEDVTPHPFDQFKIWMKEAIDSELYEPNAMTLATSTADGKPSARVVLLKDITSEGFVFYTNYLSRKGRELNLNPHAALVFLWGGLEREVRIEGSVRQLLREESEAYFRQRPRESQISALVSPQSQEVSKSQLEETWNQIASKYADEEVPLPEHWGGYEVLPEKIEFWQGRPGRFHDRILYTLQHQTWNRCRLAP